MVGIFRVSQTVPLHVTTTFFLSHAIFVFLFLIYFARSLLNSWLRNLYDDISPRLICLPYFLIEDISGGIGSIFAFSPKFLPATTGAPQEMPLFFLFVFLSSLVL